MYDDSDFSEITANGVRLGSSWPELPASHLGVGIGVTPGALVAWCAPKLGRVATRAFADHEEFDRLRLTAWLIDQGFSTEDAAAASCELVTRLNTLPDS